MTKLFKIIGGVIGVLAIAVAITVHAVPAFGGDVSGERLDRAKASPHHNGETFVNVVPQRANEASWVWEQIDRQFFGDEQRYPPSPLPLVKPSRESFALGGQDRLAAIWLGHASSFLHVDGANILIDPVFSDVVSPISFAGPKRLHPVPIEIDKLPKIDAVLISHDHYDHLDMATVQRLAAKGARFYVPLGVGAHLERWGISPRQFEEMDWGDERRVGKVRIVSTEARHYSGRGLTNQNETFWSSWAVIGPSHSAYYSGDTGFSGHFAEIGKAYGPFDLTLIKIGAYGPGLSWIDIHMSAEDAVRAHVAVGGKEMLPVHWSSFNLAFHAWNEPIERALAEAKRRNIRILTPKIGEMVEAGGGFQSTVWWKLHAPKATGR